MFIWIAKKRPKQRDRTPREILQDSLHHIEVTASDERLADLQHYAQHTLGPCEHTVEPLCDIGILSDEMAESFNDREKPLGIKRDSHIEAHREDTRMALLLRADLIALRGFLYCQTDRQRRQGFFVSPKMEGFFPIRTPGQHHRLDNAHRDGDTGLRCVIQGSNPDYTTCGLPDVAAKYFKAQLDVIERHSVETGVSSAEYSHRLTVDLEKEAEEQGLLWRAPANGVSVFDGRATWHWAPLRPADKNSTHRAFMRSTLYSYNLIRRN